MVLQPSRQPSAELFLLGIVDGLPKVWGIASNTVKDLPNRGSMDSCGLHQKCQTGETSPESRLVVQQLQRGSTTTGLDRRPKQPFLVWPNAMRRGSACRLPTHSD